MAQPPFKHRNQLRLDVHPSVQDDVAVIKDYYDGDALSKILYPDLVMAIKKRRAEIPATFVINRGKK